MKLIYSLINDVTQRGRGIEKGWNLQKFLNCCFTQERCCNLTSSFWSCTVSVQTSMNFRHSITAWFPNSSVFRHIFVSKSKLHKTILNSQFRFQTIFGSYYKQFNYINMELCVWYPNSSTSPVHLKYELSENRTLKSSDFRQVQISTIQWYAKIWTFKIGKVPKSEQMLVRTLACSDFERLGFKISNKYVQKPNVRFLAIWAQTEQFWA